MDEKQLKNLELRLERIEKAIDNIAKPVVTRAAKLSEDDIAAYHRVREVLWEDGTCGINETSPCVISCRIVDRVCKVIPICRVCDVECTCGPCNIWSGFQPNYGALNRFRTLGQ